MTASSGFSKRSQVFVRYGCQTLPLLSIVVLHHRIGGHGISTLKAVPHVTSVGTDLAEFVKPTQLNADVSFARVIRPGVATVIDPP